MIREVKTMPSCYFYGGMKQLTPLTNVTFCLATGEKETGNKSGENLLPFSGTGDMSVEQEKRCYRCR